MIRMRNSCAICCINNRLISLFFLSFPFSKPKGRAAFLSSSPPFLIYLPLVSRAMQRQIGGFLVGQKHAVLAQHKVRIFPRRSPLPDNSAASAGTKVVFAAPSACRRRTARQNTQVAHEPRIVDALGAHRAVHTVGDNVGTAHRSAAALPAWHRSRPAGPAGYLTIWKAMLPASSSGLQLDAKLCLYLLQAALATRLAWDKNA